MFLRKLLKLMIKKGKKPIAAKNLTETLQKLRPYIAPSKLTIVFKKLAPLVKIYKKKVAGKVYQLPWHISKKRSAFQAAKWIMMGIEAEKKGKDLSVKLGKQLVRTWRDKGLPLKLKEQFIAIIKENRSYMRFIRKKFIKKPVKKFNRYRAFRSRYTKGTIRYRLRTLKKGKNIFKGKSGGNLKLKNGKNNNKKINRKNKKHWRKI